MAIPTPASRHVRRPSIVEVGPLAGRLRRTGLIVSLVVMLLPMAAASSLGAKPAANEFWKFSEAGTSASAEWVTCMAEGELDTCITTMVFVGVTKTRSQGSGAATRKEVCFSRTTETFDDETGETLSYITSFGCTPAATKATGVRRDLSSAIIAPTTVTVQTFECGLEECVEIGNGEVTVSGTFTATGPMTRARYREFSDDGFCVNRVSFRGKSRLATFSGTVDGEPVETEAENDLATIRQGSGMSSSTCPPDEE